MEFTGASWLRTVVVICGLGILFPASGINVAAQKKEPKPTGMEQLQAWSEEDTLPISPDDLAYKIVLVDDCIVPADYAKEDASNGKKALEHLASTKSEAITRLKEKKGFSRVEPNTGPVPDEPFLVVKCSLSDYRIVGRASRFWGGAMAANSRMGVYIRISDGQSGKLTAETELYTSNSSWGAAYSMGGTDADVPLYIGKLIGEYTTLRAKKDRGESVLPMERVIPDDASYTDTATGLMWSAKDSTINVSHPTAVEWAKNFRGGGFEDWRLPTGEELKTLYTKTNKTTNRDHEIYAKAGIQMSSPYYWTNQSSGKKADFFDFYRGKTRSENALCTSEIRALAVRRPAAQ